MGEIKSFAELYTSDYQLTSLFGLSQYWHEKKTFAMPIPRPTHALLLFVECEAVYTASRTGKRIDVPRGSLFFLPAGAKYTWSFSNTKPKEISTLLLEFSLLDTQGEPLAFGESARVLFAHPSEHCIRLFERAVTELSAPAPIPARAKAAVYSLLADIAGEGRAQSALCGRISVIERSMRYLEADPKQSLSIAEVAALSNVSTNYFERLFKEYTGLTPCAYRAVRKAERAKRLLEDGFHSVGEIASFLGFEDEAYFCRFFKAHTGVTPSGYRKNKNHYK